MKIKPIQIALFLLLVLLILLGLMWLSPKDGIQKAQTTEDGIAIEGIEIKYPSYQTFLGLTKDTTATHQDILKVTQTVVPVEEKDTLPQHSNDTLRRPDFSKIDTTRIVRIRYPDSVPDFAAQLQAKLSSGNCRIFHYGDSQIEGDRITGYLRNRLQGMYGGNGPGFIPVLPVYHQVSAKVIPSAHWSRYAIFDPKTTKFEHRKYGAYMSVSRFTEVPSIPLDSVRIDTLPLVKATVTIGKSKQSYAKFRTFTNIGLHYGNCHFPIKISVYNNEVLIQEDQLQTDGNYHKYTIKTASTPSTLKIVVEGKVSADFYGLTLDGNRGVQIDNVAMRGSSGTIFTGSSASNYARMAQQLQPKIVIMQYGGNTVPYLKDSTSVMNYAKYMKSQMNWIRKRTKQAQIIFIGPTDMCLPVNGTMETYPLLPYLNTTLQETCLQNNVAYWNMYTAMGGKGAMKYWVEEGLAGSDHTHFTNRGVKIISELFFTALYLDLVEK